MDANCKFPQPLHTFARIQLGFCTSGAPFPFASSKNIIFLERRYYQFFNMTLTFAASLTESCHFRQEGFNSSWAIKTRCCSFELPFSNHHRYPHRAILRRNLLRQ
jgi:hypothetical protein